MVLRDGATRGEAEAAEVDLKWIVEHMVGRNPDSLFPGEHAELGAELLAVDGLTVADPANPGRLASTACRSPCAPARSSASTA